MTALIRLLNPARTMPQLPDRLRGVEGVLEVDPTEGVGVTVPLSGRWVGRAGRECLSDRGLPDELEDRRRRVALEDGGCFTSGGTTHVVL